MGSENNIFKKRVNYKPFEYPEVMQFIEAINKTYWVHSEVDFTADVQDFMSNLDDREREVVKRSLLSIAQVEVGVKTFWGDLYRHLPKPEFNGLGSTFAECEFRHSEAYARLLEVLGYNDEFERLVDIPVFKDKVELIEKHLNPTVDIQNKLLFFTIVIENSSLFSHFANILSFTRFKGYMKNVSNIIGWTSVDEQIHANAGIYILNEIKKEGILNLDVPMLKAVLDAYVNQESNLIDWIYELGELDFFTKEDLLNFMKYRIDESLVQLGIEKIFNITSEQYKPMSWFEEEVFANESDDFFAKRPTAYTKHDKSITANDLF